MDWLLDIEWDTVLAPSVSPIEIVVRGTVVYLALFFLLRFVLKREAAALSVSDLLVVVLIADAAQNAMGDDYRSVPDGILLVSVIIGWAWLLDWISFRSERLERLLKPPKLPLVKDGRMITPNMARELVTREELTAQLRMQGIEDISSVRAAYMEHNGAISVILHEERQNPGSSEGGARAVRG